MREKLLDDAMRGRSFTHVADACTAFLTPLGHPEASNEIFSIGDPAIYVTVPQVADLMCDLYEEVAAQPARLSSPSRPRHLLWHGLRRHGPSTPQHRQVARAGLGTSPRPARHFR